MKESKTRELQRLVADQIAERVKKEVKTFGTRYEVERATYDDEDFASESVRVISDSCDVISECVMKDLVTILDEFQTKGERVSGFVSIDTYGRLVYSFVVREKTNQEAEK